MIKIKTRQFLSHSQHHYSEIFLSFDEILSLQSFIYLKAVLSPLYTIMWTVVTKDPDSQYPVA